MKIKVSDFIVDFLNKNNINTLFTITGGFSMHLNDSFGKNKNYDIYYQHHEQACGYSAVGYSKTNNKPCAVCITSGCASTNTLSPCLVAYQDSLPILFISGQSKSTEITRVLNTESMNLRHYSGQDCDIISIVKPITKYAYEITKVDEIHKILCESIKHLINGRPGPVWLSIPIDIQGLLMENSTISIIEKENIFINNFINQFDLLNSYLQKSSRPLIIAGNGIKLGMCNKKFEQFLKKYKIPVVVTWHGTDSIETENELYCGKIGILGDRCGNFTIQNCDLILSFGCRMAQPIIGYSPQTFSRESIKIIIDIDKNELEKTNLIYDLKINVDINIFFDEFNYVSKEYSDWINICNNWKQKWLFEMPENYLNDIKGINPYYALNRFFDIFPGNKNIICASGSIVTNIWHSVKIKKNDKFIISSQGDMGFELTASIGSYIADKYNNKIIVPIFGEGSLQLNIQELQTIVHHKFPIKILIFNNNSYGANVITQDLYFKEKYGSDNDSGISFPSTEKIAGAYGISYICMKHNNEVNDIFLKFLKSPTTIICEVFCSIQQRVPKLSSIKNNDGTFSSRPYEDMEPFIDRDEFKRIMIINPL
jgi:acetolactate synthase-1/2/3 large subunit